VLLNSEELLPAVPRDPHDRAVTAAVTEQGLHRF
jgi:5-formyltetrahydrofolate cyclo-ligase